VVPPETRPEHPEEKVTRTAEPSQWGLIFGGCEIASTNNVNAVSTTDMHVVQVRTTLTH